MNYKEINKHKTDKKTKKKRKRNDDDHLMIRMNDCTLMMRD